MSFRQKLQEEYGKNGLFSDLKINKTENSKPSNTITIKGPNLECFEYVLKHPNTDLERIYIKELVNIVKQYELEKIMPKLNKIKTPIKDYESNIIFTNTKNKYKKAKIVYCSINKDLCIPKNKLLVKTNLIEMNLEKNQIISQIQITTNPKK